MTINLLLSAFLLFATQAQEFEDIGVVTARKGIYLEKPTNRLDFSHFQIDLFAQRWPSNKVSFTKTNDVLLLSDFMAMPPGPCLMGVKIVCSDGEESPIAIYRVDVRRDPPKAPKAHSIIVAPGPTGMTTEQIIQHRYATPPSPFRQSSGGPLPGGEPKTYSDHMIEMHEFVSVHSTKRRSE